MKTRVFHASILILILAAGIFLAVQNHLLRKKLHYCNQVLTHLSSPNVDINHLKKIVDKYLSAELRATDFKWKLIIIYTPEDCSDCLEEIDYWAKFCDREKKIGCWGLVNHPYPELVSKFFESRGWRFPNRIIKEHEFGENFGLFKTPIKVLLNTDNQLYYVEGPLVNYKEEGKLRIFLKSLM